MSAARKYDQKIRDRAVRMYQDRLTEGGISQLKVREEVGVLLDINQSTVRNWIRQQETEGTTSTTVIGDAEIAELRREVARLRRANEILRTASAFFATAEFDRNPDSDQLHPLSCGTFRGRADMRGAHRARHPDCSVDVL